MANFVFKPIADIPFVITDEAGNEIKRYTLKAGSEEYFKLVVNQGSEILKKFSCLSNGEAEVFLESMKSFVDYCFGEGEFDALYAAFGKNPFAMLELIAEVCKLGRDELEKKFKKYV